MLPEGTIVDSGDVVANLDKSTVTSKLQDIQAEIDQIQARLTQKILDTTMTLKSAREEIINIKYQLEENKIAVQESKFEPPAVQRKAKITQERSERQLKQTIDNYKLKEQKATAEIFEIQAQLNKQVRSKDNLVEIIDEFSVKAPESGMLIYEQSWRGKIKAGSTISPWDPIVAKLPDLSSMISKTYINEVDISKIKKDQEVKVTVDAFPDKKYRGTVITIANIGQQLPKSTAKVFEVIVKLLETDSTLRPAMTTNNKVFIEKFEDVLFVPIEGVYKTDSIEYVYKKSGFSIFKQEVKTGKENENNIIIEAGLSPGDKILLNKPEEEITELKKLNKN